MSSEYGNPALDRVTTRTVIMKAIRQLTSKMILKGKVQEERRGNMKKRKSRVKKATAAPIRISGFKSGPNLPMTGMKMVNISWIT